METHTLLIGFLQVFFRFFRAWDCSLSLLLFFCLLRAQLVSLSTAFSGHHQLLYSLAFLLTFYSLHSLSLISFVRVSTVGLQPCLRESLTRRFTAKEFSNTFKEHSPIRVYKQDKKNKDTRARAFKTERKSLEGIHNRQVTPDFVYALPRGIVST